MTLCKTPLDSAHRRLGAKMVPFAGFEMPLQYAGIVEEHRQVRTSAGLFDVSHMGEFVLQGPGAEALLQATTPNDVVALRVGRAHYSSLLTPAGTFVDDILVYRRGPQDFMVVVNASNADKDAAWLRAALDRTASTLPGPATFRDVSAETALLALQGPRAVEIIAKAYRPAGAHAPADLKYYGFLEGGTLADRPVEIVSRTGYTGEDGFELYLRAEHAEAVWDALLEDDAVRPTGLGARDTLRLEAAMSLYGNDIDDTVTPIEAGLEWTVKVDKGEFVGREVLRHQLQEGTDRKLVGLEMVGRGIARPGQAVLVDGQPAGRVTSGTHSPTLGRAIALAYVPTAAHRPGTELAVDVRGQAVAARVVALPFYSRKRK